MIFVWIAGLGPFSLSNLGAQKVSTFARTLRKRDRVAFEDKKMNAFEDRQTFESEATAICSDTVAEESDQ